MTVAEILNAMRADTVPAGDSGLWEVRKGVINAESRFRYWKTIFESGQPAPPDGKYTYLLRWTNDTLFRGYGELVMNDFPCELKKHLEFVLKARGRVLVTGLGLGCVVRGLLAADRVDSIELVERDEHVVKLCYESVRHPKVKLHVADARQFLPDGHFDFCWHDLWSDPDKGEPHLQVTHMDLMARLIDRAGTQGAWAMPRRFTRLIPEFRLEKPDAR